MHLILATPHPLGPYSGAAEMERRPMPSPHYSRTWR